jgi:hypothetical protein
MSLPRWFASISDSWEDQTHNIMFFYPSNLILNIVYLFEIEIWN